MTYRVDLEKSLVSYDEIEQQCKQVDCFIQDEKTEAMKRPTQHSFQRQSNNSNSKKNVYTEKETNKTIPSTRLTNTRTKNDLLKRKNRKTPNRTKWLALI